MRIVVCVKWVPQLRALKFDPETRRLVREGVPGELSGFDVRAIVRRRLPIDLYVTWHPGRVERALELGVRHIMVWYWIGTHDAYDARQYDARV